MPTLYLTDAAFEILQEVRKDISQNTGIDIDNSQAIIYLKRHCLRVLVNSDDKDKVKHD